MGDSLSAAPSGSSRGVLRWVLRGIGVVLFVWVLGRIDLGRLAEILTGASLDWLGVAVILTVVAALLKALRWWLLLEGSGIHLRAGETLRYSWIGSSLGVLTPGKIGELVRIAYVVDRGERWWPVARTAILDRVFDLVNLMTFSLWGVLVVFVLPGIVNYGTVLAPLLVGLSLMAVLSFREYLRPLIRRAASRLRGGEEEGQGSVEKGRNGGGSRGYLGASYLASAVLYFCFVARIYSLGRAVHWAPDWWLFVGLVSLSLLVATLPISVLDIGTRDVAFVYFFGLVGLPEENAIAISTLLLVLMILQTSLGVGMWLLDPPRLRRGWRGGAPGQESRA